MVLRQSVGVKKGSGTTWFCKCDCGNYTDVASTKLIQGTTKSCGCQLKKAREKWKNIYKDEKIQEKIKKLLEKMTVVKKILNYLYWN
jgi:coenzyme F420-reducing hydrogenase delta subunit